MVLDEGAFIQAFIDEAIEHLADIEQDLLAIEAFAGQPGDTRPNDNLINKVFRAAHSIKGGAGVAGLKNINRLAHKMENVLGQIRGHALRPNAEIINFLLLAADALKELVANYQQSDEMVIEPHLKALNRLVAPTSRKPAQLISSPVASPVATKAKGSTGISAEITNLEPRRTRTPSDLSISSSVQQTVRREGKRIYQVEIDLDVSGPLNMESASPPEYQANLDVFEPYGNILAYGVVDAMVLEQKQRRLLVLFACALTAADMALLLEIDRQSIFLWSEEEGTPDQTAVTDEDTSAQSTEPVAPVQVPESNRNLRPSPDPPASEAAIQKVSSPESDKVPSPAGKPKAETPPKSPGEAAVDTDRPKPLVDSLGLAEREKRQSNLRVRVELLDLLMNLAGELVLGRNQLLQNIASREGRASERVAQRINAVTSELQEAIMLTRLQPVATVFDKFPRVVRDMSRKLAKRVHLTMEGSDVELDKTLVEAISDPLTHLVRNAVSHGIESPPQRHQSGKDDVGRIRLKAYHEGGQVHIEIADDGIGLDSEQLARTARAKGLITKAAAEALTAKERINLIFMPGFSTAETVSEVSGRGVGMDVVKTNLTRVGGQVEVNSVVGEGTVVHLKLPLTLAIIPSQIIVCEGMRYALPQINILELIRIPAAQAKERMAWVGNAQVLRLRGFLLPLIRLSDAIGSPRTYRDPSDGSRKADRRRSVADRRSMRRATLNGTEQDSYAVAVKRSQKRYGDLRRFPDRRYHAVSAWNIVVVASGNVKYGLIVDSLMDAEEIVVKPLGQHLKTCREYAGATIMGDGQVALILDVANLLYAAGFPSIEAFSGGEVVDPEKKKHHKRSSAPTRSLLICRSSAGEPFAVPLWQVRRIQRIRTDEIQQVGGKRAIPYRGGNLPLFTLSDVAQVATLPARGNMLAFVFEVAQHEIGLLADGVVDAVDTVVRVDKQFLKQPGISGSAIIDGQITLLVDIYEIVRLLNPHWEVENMAVWGGDDTAPRIMVVEDSNFFRGRIKQVVEDAGYNVLEAEDGAAAWEMLQQKTVQVAAVVSDLEMPRLDGFGLVRRIRQSASLAGLPVIALTTLADDRDIERGRSAGFDEYLIKLDPERLIDTIGKYIT